LNVKNETDSIQVKFTEAVSLRIFGPVHVIRFNSSKHDMQN